MDLSYYQGCWDVNNQCGWTGENHGYKVIGMSLADRINQKMTELQLTQELLAKRSGVSQTAIHKLCTGKSMQSRKIVQIASALGVTPEWLESGTLHSTLTARATLSGKLTDASDISPAAITGQRVPVLSSVQAGNWREIVDAYAMGGADSYVMAIEPVSKHGFALTVEGDSMTPDFQPGDTLFINPEIKPNPGDFVVARNHKAEATFKRYRPRGLNAAGVEYFELVPLNENHPTLRSDLTAIEIIGVVVEHRRRLRVVSAP